MKVRFLGPIDENGAPMLVTFESLAEADVFSMLMSYDVTLPREVKRYLNTAAHVRDLGEEFVRDMMLLFHTEIVRASPQRDDH